MKNQILLTLRAQNESLSSYQTDRTQSKRNEAEINLLRFPIPTTSTVVSTLSIFLLSLSSK